MPPAGTPNRVSCTQCGSQYALKRPDLGGTRTRALAPAPYEPETTKPSLRPPGGVRPEAVPARIGPYEIVQVLGRGGMGVVYKGRDAALDRWVAVKTLLPSMVSDTEAHERFLREARSAAALSHPNLTQIYSIGEDSGTPYFAMEFIEGQTLAQKIERDGRLKPSEAVRLMRQVALGLQEAQRFQLIHRDIKPANLILTADGTVKITDFGLAKRAQGPASMQLTATGQAIGSPLYMSPEQARGAEVDHRSDLYSLGATLFHLLAGRPPFQAASPMDVVMKHLQEPAPSPRTFAPEVSYPLAGLVQRLLRKRPEDRFPNYRTFLDELERVEAVERGGSTVQQPVPVWVRERRGASWASIAGLLALCSAIGIIGFRALSGARDSGIPEESGSGGFSGAAEQAAGSPARPTPDRGATGLQVDISGQGGGRTAGARLRVTDLQQAPVLPDGMRVFGLVRNDGSRPAGSARVQVRAYDDAGNLLATESTVPERSPIEGGGAAGFEVTFQDASRVARVEAELTWSE